MFRLAYLGVTNALALLRLLPMSDRDKDAEILALRHQITVLERHLPGETMRFTLADRALLTAAAAPAAPRRPPPCPAAGPPTLATRSGSETNSQVRGPDEFSAPTGPDDDLEQAAAIFAEARPGQCGSHPGANSPAESSGRLDGGWVRRNHRGLTVLGLASANARICTEIGARGGL